MYPDRKRKPPRVTSTKARPFEFKVLATCKSHSSEGKTMGNEDENTPHTLPETNTDMVREAIREEVTPK